MREASEQSRRLSVPRLEALRAPVEALSEPCGGCRILLSERADAPSLKSLVGTVPESEVALAIGPEGGWTDQEIEASRLAGFREASLGTLILRTETAVIAALASLNYALGA